MQERPDLALVIVRVAAAGVMIVHGVARASLDIVDDFGVALAGWGLPAGHALAWLLTAVEVVGGAALAAGQLIRPLALWFIAELVAGIVLVHAPSGWFVVGAGRNGAEFSVLLVLCFCALLLAGTGARRAQAAGSPDSVTR